MSVDVDRSDTGRSLISKRLLVELSHAIEQLALAADPDAPLVVIAMFQKLSYFQREAEVYGEIAQRGALTLVGLVEDFPPALPAGVRHNLLGRNDPLAREWSVTVLGPGGGATLVAIDQETVEDDALTVEQGRQFLGRWSFRRDDAYRETLRLRAQLRLPPATIADIDQVLRAVDTESLWLPPAGWWDAPLRYFTRRLDDALRGWGRTRADLDTARHGSVERDPRSGLFTAAYLQRWTAGLGVGTLPIGLVALRLLDLALVRERYGMRIELATLQTVARALQGLATGPGRVIQIDRADFLIVLPGARVDTVHELAHDACARVAQLEQSFPFVAVATAAAATVTRDRPLPVQRLLDEVPDPTPGDGGVRLLAG